MKDLESLSASQAVQALAKREIKATDLLLACLDRIGQRESTVKAWVSLGKENALARARELIKVPLEGFCMAYQLASKIYTTPLTSLPPTAHQSIAITTLQPMPFR